MHAPKGWAIVEGSAQNPSFFESQVIEDNTRRVRKQATTYTYAEFPTNFKKRKPTVEENIKKVAKMVDRARLAQLGQKNSLAAIHAPKGWAIVEGGVEKPSFFESRVLTTERVIVDL